MILDYIHLNLKCFFRIVFFVKKYNNIFNNYKSKIKMNSILRNVNKIPALFTFKLNLAKEYQPFIYDLIRMAIIHTMINILSHAANPSEIELFGSSYFTILCFILIGVSTYWLIVNKLFRFEFNKQNDCSMEDNHDSHEQEKKENHNKENKHDDKKKDVEKQEEDKQKENKDKKLEDKVEKNHSINDVLANDETAEKNASCEN